MRSAVIALALVGCFTPKASDPSLEARVKKLEDTLAKREASLAFLAEVYEKQKDQIEAEAAREPAEDAIFAINIRDNLAAGMVEGSASAPVTIVKAFDFACPYCQKVNDTLEVLMKQYGGKVRVVYKNFVVHPDAATPGHLGSCAAAKQQKYVEFKNAFWEKAFKPYYQSGGNDQASLGHENILKIAGELGVDTKRFDTDMKSPECQALIAADMAELEKFKVGSTPTLFVNGTHVAGALPKKAFQTLIDEKLAIAAKSGVTGADYYEKEIFGKGEKKFRSKKEPKQ